MDKFKKHAREIHGCQTACRNTASVELTRRRVRHDALPSLKNVYDEIVVFKFGFIQHWGKWYGVLAVMKRGHWRGIDDIGVFNLCDTRPTPLYTHI